MTLQTLTSRTSYPGTGSTGPFAIPFRIQSSADLLVVKRSVALLETTLALTTDYTVDAALANVTLVVALAAGETLAIRRKPANTQLMSIRNQGAYFPATIEDEIDRLDMQIQALQDQLDRSFGVSESYDPASLNLRPQPGTAGQVLAWGSATQLTNSNVSTGAVVLPGNGRTTTTLSAFLANNAAVNVNDFAPVGVTINNGVGDATSAMQAAHNLGVLVYYPAGTYKFSSITNINSGGIVGDGPGNTILISTDTTAGPCIKFTGRLPIGGINNANGISNISTFRDFLLAGATAKVAGAGIQVSPPAGESSDLFFENIVFQTLPIGIDFVAASLWRVLGCIFNGSTVAGIQVANTNSNDSGDVFVIGCIFQGAIGVSGPCILYKSAAGLKVEGCKMNGGTYGLLVQWTGTGSGDLVFWGNSVENMSVSGVALTRVAAAVFHNIQIVGNEFSLCTNTITSDVASAILTLLLSGNIFSQNVAGTTTGITLNGVTGLTIEGNIFRGNGGTPVGINLTSCDTVDIGINTYIGITTNTIFTTCTNLTDHNVNQGSTSLLNTVATTIFTLPSTPGFYEMWAYLPTAAGGTAATTGTARIASINGSPLIKIGGENGAACVITVSGLNVQLTQNTGATQTYFWGYRRIA